MHKGDRPWIKFNGYPSQIYRKCDECGEMYDLLWPFGCLGGGVKMLDNYPDVLTIDDVRAILRVGRGAAYDAIKTGLIPSFRVGKQIRVYRDKMKEVLSEGNGKEQDPR